MGRLLSNVSKEIFPIGYMYFICSARVYAIHLRFIAVIKFGDYHTNVSRKYNFHMNWIWIFMSLYLHTVNACYEIDMITMFLVIIPSNAFSLLRTVTFISHLANFKAQAYWNLSIFFFFFFSFQIFFPTIPSFSD